MNKRIKLVKIKSPWGNITYDLFVDDVYVSTYRLRSDAARVGEEHIKQIEMEAKQLDEDMRLEFGE